MRPRRHAPGLRARWIPALTATVVSLVGGIAPAAVAESAGPATALATAPAMATATSPGRPATSAVTSSSRPATATEIEADKAAADLSALQPQLNDAVAAYQRSLDELAGRTTRAVQTQRRSADAQARLQADRRRLRGSARALYMSGGRLALYVGVLDSGSTADLMAGIESVERVVASHSAQASASAEVSGRLAAAAARAEAAADLQVVTARDVEASLTRLTGLVDAAQRRLDALSAQARSERAAREAAAALAAARRAAAQARASATVDVAAQLAPADYAKLYPAAAATCPGLDWQVLSAIGQVESGHGRNAGVSSAGAMGPMQFMPATFAAYAVDGDGDGQTDIFSPADAIFTAAHYLCANGGGDPARLRDAIWHYNHAQWYVDLVLGVAAKLGYRPSA